MSASGNIKRIVIIAGPNGAGKTTFAREFLPTDAELPNFVNADLIAAGSYGHRPRYHLLAMVKNLYVGSV